MRKKFARLILLGLALSLVAGCAGKGLYTKGYYSGQSGKHPNGVHIVQPGETLYSIAFQYRQDYREVARWNDIGNDFTIYPEQELKITKPARNPARRPLSVTKVNKTNEPQKSIQKPREKQLQTQTKKRIGSHILSWQWPARGAVLSRFSPSDPGQKGIRISGQKGSPIYAAEAGYVVYSGSGLRGYGKLIIIKHNETFLSAYAHNNRIHVREGEKVKKGERIADMGNTGTVRVNLHFEIRRNGTPVNPFKYLPKRLNNNK